MRKIKQFLLTTAVLICSTLNSWAQTTFTDLDITYEITSLTTAKVISCSSNAADIRIGNTVDYGGKSYTVNAIGEGAFKNKKNLEYIQFGSGVQSIGKNAFYGCTNLWWISYLSYVNYIGDYAFYGCTRLERAAFGKLTKIGDYAFAECTSLTYADYNGDPCKLNSVGNYAFYNCTALAEIDVSTVRTIGDHAFENCTSLGGIATGNYLTSIGEYAFNGCSKMTTFKMENSETTLGKCVFYECSKLSNVTLSYKITSIPEDAFCLCTKLASIKIPSNATTIERYAFEGCSSLSSVTGGGSITKIEGGAFYGCTSLKEFTIPEKASDVSPFAFYSCTSLTKFFVSSTSSYYSVSDGILYDKNKTKIVKYPNAKTGSYTLLSSVSTIGAGAFYECSGITSFTIPRTVKTIEADAFYGTGITTITIPSTVTTMGESAVCVSKIYCDVARDAQPAGWNRYWYSGTVYWAQVVTVESNNTNYGTVTGGGTYRYGTTVTLTATPKTGYVFVGWSDGGTQTHNITATETKTYTATFLPEITIVSQSNYQSLGLTSDHIGYYAISNANELYGFAEIVNSGITDVNAVLISDITVNSNVLKTDGSGELNGDGSNFRAWTPIGTEEHTFIGTFDGNGHTISGLYFNNTVAESYPNGGKYVGLIGHGDGATIKNIGVIDSYLNGYGVIGGIAGKFGTITNCYNTGTVSGSFTIGGIVGSTGTITNCYNTGTIIGSGSNIGGICGYYGTQTNCYNTGSITSSGNNVAGICGCNGFQTDCHNEGIIISSGNSVAGICGYEGSQTNCYNTGSVTGSSSVGGIASSYCTQTNCYNTGSIMGDRNVGGIACCYSYQTNCYNTGSVTGTYNVGGIVSSYSSYGKQSNCYNTGAVTGSYNVGGIVGGISVGTGNQDNCYYLEGCAIDGSNTVQNGVGCSTQGQTTSDQEGTISITTNVFASGAVALLLNGGTNEGPWFQTVGEDASPVLDESHDRVGMLVTEGNTITASGDVVLLEDYTIEEGKTLVIPANVSVSTLTTRALVNNGRIVCNGNLSGFNFSGSGRFVFENLTESDITFNTTCYPYKGSAYTLESGLDVTIGRKMCGKTFTYDGTATVTYSNNTNAGEANAATATWNGTISKQFTIMPKVVTLEWGTASFTYNGSAQAPSATATGLVMGDVCEVAVNGAQISAGENLTAIASTLSNANYKLPEDNTKVFTINQKEVMLVWDESAITYNGTAQAPSVTASGLISGDVCEVTISGAQTNAGTSYTATAESLSNANYKLPEDNTKVFAINPKEVSNPTITLSATSFTYNASEYRPKVTSVLDGTTIISSKEFTVGYSNNINAGIATVTIIDRENGNYIVNGSTTFVIDPIVVSSPTISLSETSYTYNGEAQKPTLTVRARKPVIPESEYTVVYPEDATSAGEKTITIIDNENGNYTVSGSATYVINKRFIELAWDENELPYNGSAQAPTVTALGLVEGDDCNVIVVGAQTNVGGPYTATATALSNDNYRLPKRVTSSFTIIPKEVSLAWGENTLTYNGTAQTPTVTATGLFGNDVCNVIVSGAQTDKGTYTATAESLSNENYKLPASVTKEFSIAPKEVVLNWSNTPLTYNGSEQMPTATATGLVGNDVCNVTVTGEQTNAGTHTATATTLDNGNYKLPNNKTKAFTIDQKVVTLEWGTASFTYNGSEQVPTATATGLVDGDVCNVTVSGAQIDADTYTATASTLSNNNYKLPENKTKAFTINPKEVSLVWSNTTFTYNGLAQVPTATAAGLEEGDVCNVTVSGAKINADTYTATASALSNNNYKLPEDKTKSFTINPKEVSLVWGETSFTYNGSAQAPTATATGLEEGDECNVTVEGAQINHGNNYTATATGLSNANYKLPTAVTTTFSIGQATPGYTMPDNQEILCNQTLTDITLPAGFAFADVNTILAIGENTVGIIFTPEDAENYKVVDDIEITVTVNHSEVTDPAVPATCTATGLTEGSHCSVCEQELVAQEVVPMIKHTAVNDAAVPATCTATGLTEGSHCSVCDHIIVAQEVVPMAEHTESEAVKENEVAATCTENGSYNSVVYCSVCHAELSRETVTVTAPGHTAGAAVAENPKAATCTAAGSVDSVVYCTVCNAEISRKTVEIPVIAHTVVVDEAVAATTTETGLTEGSHCSVCHQVLVAQQVIPIIEGQGGNVNQGEENQGEENQGEENQGEENQGEENQGEENQGEENQGNENQGEENQGEENQGNENQGEENQGEENQGGNEGQGEENQGEENQGGNEGQGEENQGEENQGGNEGQGEENQGEENQGGNEGQGEENQGEENQGGNEGQGNENQGEENQGGNEGQGNENQGEENQGGNEEGNENQGEENQGGNEEGNENQGEENQGGNEGQGNENQGNENQGGNENEGGNENTNPGTAVDDTDALAVNIFAYGNTIVVENADADILVFDAMGRMISRTIVTTDRTELQVERAGVYVVKAGNTAKRVMIND